MMNKINLLLLFLIFCASSCIRPLAKYTYDSKAVTAPTVVQFENVSENAESYEWNFGDGNISTDENPSYRYLLSGKYDVTLMAVKGKKKNKSTKTIVVKAPDKCLVQLETEFGEVLIEVYEDTPEHRENFTKLIEEKFYDGLLFHRVIDGFMIQGGDPNSKGGDENTRLGSGGPGYQLPAEIDERFVHVKGALAAARTGDQVNPERKSSGSQFYIVHGNKVTDSTLDGIETRTGIEYTPEQRADYLENGGTPFLDMQYTVFGRVIKGLDVIDKIAATPTKPGDRPVEDVSMKMIVIK